MQQIFQSAKKRISICLVTLLLFVSTLTLSPAPARATGDVVIIKCESDCGNTTAFTAGVVAGSAVTLAATGSGAGLVAGAGAGMTAIVDTVAAAAPFAAAAVPLATAAAAAAASVVVPVAIGTAAIGGAYLLWQQLEQPSTH